MLGAIFGDVVGSVYEFNNTHKYDFVLLSRFSSPTDDTYMTLAVAKAMCETYGKSDEEIRRALVKNMQDLGHRYPDGGYGGRFAKWLKSRSAVPYCSYGNGSGMRVSPCGWLYTTMEETLHAARLSAEVTHNHPEGIKGAQAIASAIYLARAGANRNQIRDFIVGTFGYDLHRTLDDIRPTYMFDETCPGSVPEAILAFLEGKDYEDVIRKAVTLGGDSDTIACMAGGIAEAYFGMPEKYKKETLAKLDPFCRNIILEYRKCLKAHAGKPSESLERLLSKDYRPYL